MKVRELIDLGLVDENLQSMIWKGIASAKERDASFVGEVVRERVLAILNDPTMFVDDPDFGELAKNLMTGKKLIPKLVLPKRDIPIRTWLDPESEPESFQQLQDACRLPITVAGALMPDAHVGYGLPIGGVLATENAVIPYGVGVDIGCRVRITITDEPLARFYQEPSRFKLVLEEQTRFGIGAHWKQPFEHSVLYEDWDCLPILREVKNTAISQLGTSGSGNHFVEFGEFVPVASSSHFDKAHLISGTTYLAIVSHSGSRGAGGRVADYYSRLAASIHGDLPESVRKLAWLDLDSSEGQEYWYAMNLMGQYASANHEIIHQNVLRALGARSLVSYENHHNFAWREEHFGRQLIVHRKGATPAGAGEIGYIPGTMVDPGFLVEGLGNAESLRSCSHGAGRAMSRRQAIKSLTYSDLNNLLKERNVTTISCGLDEAPQAYKNINTVMQAQSDLVKILGRFTPKLVKMAPAGEKAED